MQKKPKEKHALFKIQSRKERHLAAVEGWSAKITARSYLRYNIQGPFILCSQVFLAIRGLGNLDVDSNYRLET